MTPLLLDTCAVLWTASDSRLSDEAVQSLQTAYETGTLVFVSPITSWELGILAARGRQTFPVEPWTWFNRYLEVSGCLLSSMSPDILASSSFLPGTPPRDPADRIIITTARRLGYQIVTRDREILDYAIAGNALAMEC